MKYKFAAWAAASRPRRAGLDLITDFMDDTDDAGTNTFRGGQVARRDSLPQQYRSAP